jgi:methyl-accepting chemotaxis protein
MLNRPKNLRMRNKFLLLVVAQAVLLILLTVIGWSRLQRLEDGLTAVSGSLPKVALTTQVLHDSNVLRIVHVSIIGAVKNDAYLVKRTKRLEDVQTSLMANMEKLEKASWSPEQAIQVTEAVALLRHYANGFAQVRENAKANSNPENLPALIESNFPDQSKARDLLLGIIKNLQAESALQVEKDIASSNSSQEFIILICLIAIILGLGITFFMSFQIAAETRKVEMATKALNAGDLTATIASDTQDELGDISRGLQEAMHKLREDVHAIAGFAERAASSATEMAATVNELDAATVEISRGAEERRQTIEHSTAAIQDISESIGTVRRDATVAEDLSNTSHKTTLQGKKSVEEAVEAMSAIQESSEKVGRITSVIADIARQTNLLSLNAAIEAAKAGTLGKGFAVVAEEIRKLAERSASAAKEITELIRESGERVAHGSVAVGTVDSALGTIQLNVQSLAERISQITKAMGEQARSAESVVESMGTTMQLTERDASATVQLSSSISETSHTIEDLAQLAQQLQKLTSRFKLQ